MEEQRLPALDAGLLAAAQAVEHYAISRYGTLRAWAEELGLNEAVEVLQETLEEEEGTDRNREFGDKSAGRSSLTLWRHEFSAPLLRGVFYNIVMAAVLRGNCGSPATLFLLGRALAYWLQQDSPGPRPKASRSGCEAAQFQRDWCPMQVMPDRLVQATNCSGRLHHGQV